MSGDEEMDLCDGVARRVADVLGRDLPGEMAVELCVFWERGFWVSSEFLVW